MRGQLPLHLSSNWPIGISLLLQYGAGATINQLDSNGFLPLEYAIGLNCLPTVKMMLDADCALDSRDMNRAPKDLLEVVAANRSDEMMEWLQDALVNRRNRLRDLAFSTLSLSDVATLGISTTDVLDDKASSVFAALEQRNINIPAALTVSRFEKSVFHSDFLSLPQYESLFTRGFHDVDSFCSEGLTPLMNLGYLWEQSLEKSIQLGLWLISKGADLDREHQNYLVPCTTAAHIISSGLGNSIRFLVRGDLVSKFDRRSTTIIYSGYPALEENHRLFVEQLFSKKTYDGCLCACSVHGCAPAIMMLKGLHLRLDLRAKDSTVRREMQLWVIGWMSHHVGVQFNGQPWLSQEIIRFETFERLGLTHTCCKVKKWDILPHFSDQCVDEIQDEERFLIDKLETLVTEFQAKYIELDVPIIDFLEGYWESRMNEVENEDVLDDDAIAKIRDLGVVLHDS